MPLNYVGTGVGGSIDPVNDEWTPVQGEQVRLDLLNHDGRIEDLESLVGSPGSPIGGGGGGDVVGPASATDNAIARFDGTTGELIQDSGITIADGAAGSIASGTYSGTNSGDVTLAGTPDYLTLAAQVITRALINLASHVTGRLPFANLTAATGATRLLGRGGAAGAGDFQEINLGGGLSMSGTTLSASASAPALDDVTDVVITSPVAGDALVYDGTQWENTAPGSIGGLGNANANGSAITPARSDHTHKRDVRIAKAGVDVGTRNRLNLIEGANVTLTVADDAGNDEVDVTIAASAGGSSTRSVGITIDGAGSVITTGVKGFVRVPFTGTITKVSLLSTDASATAGSIVIDIWKDTYANYPPTVADTITASAKPTLSSANKYEDATMTGWVTSVSAGDVFGFKVDSASTVTKVLLMLDVLVS